jgi:hypothetical protein
MVLGDLLKQFDDEAAVAKTLLAIGDTALVVDVGTSAARFGENVGEYAAGATRRFAQMASDDDWLGLMNTLERTTNPGTACLGHILKWALREDGQPRRKSSDCNCCGGGACGDGEG